MRISENDMCTGCSACSASCPVGAIKMYLNEEGFYEPKVDEGNCINCKKCINICPSNRNDGLHMQQAFYGWNTGKEERITSSSGGVFRALSDKILLENGIIYGAVFSDNYRDVYFTDSDHKSIENLQKSKYIVSNPEGIFPAMEKMLVSGRKVLFCAAPCQIAGFVSYLSHKKYENLVTVDFVCGGMPSVRFWHEHVDCLEKLHNSKISHVDFRSKKKGWGKLYLDIGFANGKRRFCREYIDSYYNCFMSGHVSVRESCLKCKFHDAHYSDITIADFWGYRAAGIEKYKEGLSLILANTEKGLSLIKQTDDLECYLLDSGYARYAVAPVNPTETELKNREEFFSMAKIVGFEIAAAELYPPTIYRHILKFLNNKIKMPK